jgi:hypothetical protein
VGSACRREGEREDTLSGLTPGWAVGRFRSWARSVPRGPFHVFFFFFFFFSFFSFFCFLISSITSSNLVQIDSNQFLKVPKIQGNKSGQ